MASGKGINPDLVREHIEEYKPTFVAMVHNDTASTVENPIKEVAKIAHEAGAFLYVDSVSGLGGTRFEFDNWHIGACASSAQKCIGGPSGISFLALSDTAIERNSKLLTPRSYYLDLKKYLKFSDKDEHPTTPNIAGFYCLEQALREVETEGIDERIMRHERLAAICSRAHQEEWVEVLCGKRLSV